MLSFWHLSDLHLFGAADIEDGEAPGAPASHVVIKQRLLERLATRIGEVRPGLLILSGDLLEHAYGPLAQAAKRLDVLLDAARGAGTRIVGVRGDDGHDPPLATLRGELGWDWLLEPVDTASVAGVTVVGVGGRDVAAVRELPRPAGTAILVTHLAEPTSATWQYSYAAFGHAHTTWIWKRDGHVAGRPGHLQSYWDGPGKAWPTAFIEGSVDPASGEATAHAVSLERPPFSAPATRQIYGEPGGYERPRGELVLVHAPTEPWVWEGAGLDRPEMALLDSGAWVARFRHTSDTARREVVRKVLAMCPDDVFVTPSPTGGRTEESIRYGRDLLADESLFEAFLEMSYKKDEGTQTSDR